MQYAHSLSLSPFVKAQVFRQEEAVEAVILAGRHRDTEWPCRSFQSTAVSRGPMDRPGEAPKLDGSLAPPSQTSESPDTYWWFLVSGLEAGIQGSALEWA